MLQDIPAGSVVEDEVTSELSVRFQPRGSPSSSTPQVISIGQLMESVSANRIQHKINAVSFLRLVKWFCLSRRLRWLVKWLCHLSPLLHFLTTQWQTAAKPLGLGRDRSSQGGWLLRIARWMVSTETRQRSHLHLKRYVRATSVLATLNLCLSLLNTEGGWNFTGNWRWEHIWERMWCVSGYVVHDESATS